MKPDHLMGFFFTVFFLVFCFGFVVWLLWGVGGVFNIRRTTSSKNLESSFMPQPLSRVQPDASIILGNAGHRPLAERPTLGILAMEAINSWSNVELFLLNLYMRLCGGDTALAAKIYLSLEIQTAKTAVIRAAVTSLPEQKIQDLIMAVIRIADTNRRHRDKLAHHIWGISPHSKLLDALLLADPKALIKDDIDRSQVFVYRENDFINIIEANDRLCGYGLSISFILDGHTANANGRLFDELCNEHEIQEKLNPPASKDQSLP
jgi:hypothetical protein